MSLIRALKHRNVFRVAILYLVSSWLLLQLTDVLSSILPVPEWTGSFVFVMLLIGLCPALIFSWVYEMTPEGLKRETDIDRSLRERRRSPFAARPWVIPHIARELGVAHVLEGSVRKSGNRIRITAQLIEARTDRQRDCERVEGRNGLPGFLPAAGRRRFRV